MSASPIQGPSRQTAILHSERQLSVTLINRLEALEGLSEWLNATVAPVFELDQATRFRLELVLCELLTNIIQYGFEELGESEIEVHLKLSDVGLRVEVRDEGIAFDPVTTAEAPLPQSLEEARIGGLGLHLIHHHMRDARYQREGDRNLFCMYLQEQPVNDEVSASLIACPDGGNSDTDQPPTISSSNGEPSTSDLISAQQIFRNIPHSELEPLLDECPVHHLRKGQTLIQRNSTHRALYLLLHGQLHVRFQTLGDEASIPIERGECVGEMSLFDDKPASADVVAASDCTVIEISHACFSERISSLPGITENLLATLSRRIRMDNEIIRNNLEKQLRFEHLQREIAIAADIQSSMLPSPDKLLPDHPSIIVSAVMRPAKEVGGDFYDAFALDADHVVVAVGDVSGKGVPAALFMMKTMSLLRAKVSKPKKFATALLRLNQLLCENNDSMMFVSLFVAMINLSNGSMHFANGGHPAPMIARVGKPYRPLKSPSSLLLGIDPMAVFQVERTRLKEGDRLLLFSDGVIEACGPSGVLYGEHRLSEWLTLHRDLGPDKLVRGLEDVLLDFGAGMGPADDITILALSYNPGSSDTQGEEFLHWRKNMACGDKHLDGQHKLMVDLVNRLVRTCRKKSPSPAAMIEGLDELLQTSRAHLRYENALWEKESKGVPGEITRQHRKLEQTIERLLRLASDTGALMRPGDSGKIRGLVQEHILHPAHDRFRKPQRRKKGD